MNDKNALLEFAKLITQPRDEVLDELSKLGQDKCYLPNISRMSGDLSLVKEFSHHVLDRYIFELMNKIEELEFSSGYKLYLGKDGAFFDISEISDGLAGEFMGQQGWYAKHSAHDPTPLLEDK